MTITLDRHAFAFYDVGLKDRVVEAGDFEILVGTSSRDIRLTTIIQPGSTQRAVSSADRKKLAIYYNFPKGVFVNQKDFEVLLGHPIPPNKEPKR